MTSDIKNWIFGKLTPTELMDLAYEFGRQYPIEAMRGAKDAQAERGTRITTDMIVSEVASSYRVQPKHIYGSSRIYRHAEARKAAADFMRNGLGMTLGEVGAVLGGRDHTTIMYALETLDRTTESFMRSLDVLSAMGLSYG